MKENKGLEYVILDDGTIEIEKYTGNESKVEIPTIIDGKKVTSIGCEAFFECINVMDIIIPDTINHIGKDAIKETGYYNKSTNWTGDILYLSNYLVQARKRIKGHCSIKEGTKGIADEAFFRCEDLISVSIPEGIKYIGDDIFENCISLQKVLLPQDLSAIECGMFSYCYSLNDIEIPNDVTQINAFAFTSCEKINSLVIPDSVTRISPFAFSDMYALKEIKLPKNLKKIPTQCFEGCESLVEFKIPNQIIKIKNFAFSGCENLKSITIPKSVKKIGVEVFYDCKKLKCINYEGSKEEWKNIKIKLRNRRLNEITICCTNGKISPIPNPIIKSLKVDLNSILIKWKEIKSITEYQIQIATDSEFTKDEEKFKVKDTGVEIVELKSNKRYYIRIRACKDNQVSNWSKKSSIATEKKE